MQDVVHQGLERHWGIRQTEGHDEELKLPMVRVEGFLGDVSIVHPDLVIAAAQIQLREKSCTAQLVQQLINDRDRIHVTHHLSIEGTVLDAKLPGAIVLLHQEHR
jgi:hypothetical protein